MLEGEESGEILNIKIRHLCTDLLHFFIRIINVKIKENIFR